MAATKKIPVGIENFQDMRKFNFYYIDKRSEEHTSELQSQR